jgi:alkylation response protein AidB-like acyl-CoA dehydrogenase
VSSASSSLGAEIHDSAVDLLTGLKSFERIHHGATEKPFPDEVWRAAAAAGWFATLLPEPLGGLGLGPVELGAIFRAAGRRLVFGPLYDHAVVVPLAAAVAGEAARTRLLEAIDGSATVVLANAPSAPYGHGEGSVVIDSDGSASGTIELVRFAESADRFLVPALAEGRLVLVLLEAAHARIEPMPSHDPCVTYGRLVLERAPIGPDDIIARDEEAAALLAQIRAWFLLMAACEISGAVDELHEMSVDYAKAREQFGRPIAGFQVIRHMLAAMAARTTALRNLCAAAVDDVDGHPAELEQVARVANAYATRIGRYTAEESLQVHGGIGFTAEHPLHLYFKRVLTLQGFVAEPDELLVEIGDAVLAG